MSATEYMKRLQEETKTPPSVTRWCYSCGRVENDFYLFKCTKCFQIYCVDCIVFLDAQPICEICDEGQIMVIQ